MHSHVISRRAGNTCNRSSRAALRMASLCLPLLLSSCGTRDETGAGASGDSIVPPITGGQNVDYRPAPLSCQFDDMKSWVLNGMQSYYLFADQVDRNVDLDGYDALEELIIDLRVAPNDTFSYITDEQSYTGRFTEGENVGFGWVLQRTADDELYFKLVEENSPLAAAGVTRGDQLVAINDIRAIDFFQQPGAERDVLLSSDDNGASARFTISSALGVSRTRTISKARYALATVLDDRIIERNGVRIAYLHFYQFLGTSSSELQQAFERLSAENVSELVLDMRYNFGGRVSVAAELASYLIGRGNTDREFAIYRPNATFPENTSTFHFVNRNDALQLNRVFVLQTDDTCSAAELVVNGLRPFMDVITVGGTSCGKPYASIPNTACDTVMNALELEAVNAAGAGGYYNGISADCAASDNLSQALGSTSENLLSAALGYIDDGHCPTGTTRTKSQSHALPAVLQPAWFGLSAIQPEQDNN
ncbi:S41 family peptidase [Granulosicoccus sp. 3-233]|uniref:S41 family peptidase n=1 Tax=Granulosicoccus sp. 3-233 TaxID=3417969 RepID=UPI003D328396